MARKKRPPRTNAMRLLDAQQVDYQVLTFSPDIHSATGVAETLGLDPASVYKTLVVQRAPGKPLLVMIAGHREVDLKALAAAVGEKKLSMATHREAEELTGLQVGGISALMLLKQGFEVCIDRAAQVLDEVVVSAGQRGVNLRLRVADLVQVTGARWVDATGEG
ncbi:MAG: aminoacyl-tRNA deacylase [Anaerolineae bacterium]